MEGTIPIKMVYLSGPISGYSLDERRKTFFEKQQEFEALGWLVMNPMANGLPSDSSIHQHMRRDIEMLLKCDAIYFMENWLYSVGCKVEFEVAVACGIDIYFEEAHSIDLSKKTDSSNE